MSKAPPSAISVVSESEIPDSSRTRLENVVGRCEWLVCAVSDDTASFNRVVDDAASHWILALRKGEEISEELSLEIAGSVGANQAWGYRVSRRLLYCGAQLRNEARDPGEVRLFHRRRARRQAGGVVNVQGTVVRLRSSIDLVLYASVEAHERDLAERFERRGVVRHLLAFIGSLFSVGPRALDSVVRSYLWREAGWERDKLKVES